MIWPFYLLASRVHYYSYLHRSVALTCAHELKGDLKNKNIFIFLGNLINYYTHNHPQIKCINSQKEWNPNLRHLVLFQSLIPQSTSELFEFLKNRTGLVHMTKTHHYCLIEFLFSFNFQLNFHTNNSCIG